MPGSDSSAPGHIQVKKTHMITAIGGVIAMIITAATPGFLSWLEGAGDRAKKSQEVAELANAKSDVAYQQVWNQMQLLETRMKVSEDNVRGLVQRIDMLIMLSKNESADLPLGLERPGRHSERLSGDGDALAAMDMDELLAAVTGVGVAAGEGAGGGYDDMEGVGEAGECDESPVEALLDDVNQAPIQQQMVPPEKFEAMVKEKIESDKKAKQ